MPAYTSNQVGLAKQRARQATIRLDAAAVHIDDHVRATRSRLFGVETAAGRSTPTATKWLKLASDWPRNDEAFLDETRAAEIAPGSTSTWKRRSKRSTSTSTNVRRVCRQACV